MASKDKSTYKIVPKGCFAYNPSRINVGSVDWLRNEERVIVSPLYNVFSVSHEINQQYLYYYLKSNRTLQYIKATAEGSVRDNLKLSMLYEFMIDLRPLFEQTKIAQRLDMVQKIIALRKQELEKFDDLIKARFVELFGNPAYNEKEWIIKELESVTNVVTYGLTVRPEYIDEGIDLVSARELHKGFVAYEEAPKISEEDFRGLSEKGKPQKNDILFSKTGSIGHCALVEDDKPFAITQNAARIGLDVEKVNPLWMLYYLRMDYIQDWCKSHAKGNAVKDFQLQDMKMIPLFECPIELQNSFSEFVKQVDKSKVVA